MHKNEILTFKYYIKMKKTMCLASMMLASVCAMAQGVETSGSSGSFVVDVTTFTGVMSLVSMIITQVCKIIPAIGNRKWAKMLTSVAVGAAVVMVCWLLQVSDYLIGAQWWQALVAGIAVGLSSAGLYDVVKAVWGVFKPTEGDKDKNV